MFEIEMFNNIPRGTLCKSNDDVRDMVICFSFHPEMKYSANEFPAICLLQYKRSYFRFYKKLMTRIKQYSKCNFLI